MLLYCYFYFNSVPILCRVQELKFLTQETNFWKIDFPMTHCDLACAVCIYRNSADHNKSTAGMQL